MMNEDEKQEKINKRMAALRAKRKPPKLSNIHPKVLAIPDGDTLSYVNIKKWINTQESIVKASRLVERSRNKDIPQKQKDKAMRTRLGAQAYIRALKRYLNTNDWSTMYYGEYEDQLMGWTVVAPAGKDINSNNDQETRVSNKDDEGKLELSIRILGNEIIGFKMVVDDFKIKWMLLGLLAVGTISYILVSFGPQLMETFNK